MDSVETVKLLVTLKVDMLIDGLRFIDLQYKQIYKYKDRQK